MFINFKDNTNLDGMGFSPFAKVTKGMDVIDKIAKVKTTSKSGHQDVPETAVVIDKVTVTD